ncbi:hypothetical protein BGZ72_000610 [Mortierella alpina]|nr:hypothetical protein BGZ72_000610 [Mortierella alpina]
MTMTTRLDKAQAIVQHILRHLSSPRRGSQGADLATAKPLFVGISGPQGIGKLMDSRLAILEHAFDVKNLLPGLLGKTTMTNKLVATLSGAPHNLRVVTLSMDDLYLPFKDQEALRQKHPENKLLEFRGLPGTHDIALGTQTFKDLCAASHARHSCIDQRGEQGQGQERDQDNSVSRTAVAVPSYDKALHAGRGDQLPREQWPVVHGPFDVVLFEGWSLGFRSVREPKKLLEIYQQHAICPPHYLGQHSFASLEMVNRSLEEYEREWYSFLDVFVHLSAPSLATVFKWRAEQERDLWARKGTGMTEEQVKEFVSRFMPAYEVYLERLEQENLFKEEDLAPSSTAPSGPASWTGRHLRLNLNETRDLVSTVQVE